MKLTPNQFQAITRYRYLGGTRPQGVPSISKAALGETEFLRVLRWWATFDAWMKWKDNGGKRPPVWKFVPPFAWLLRVAIIAKRGTVPKPPGVPVIPHPPVPAWTKSYQNMVYAGENPLLALNAKAKYAIAFTADPQYDEWASAVAADQCRAQGHGVFCWYVPTQVSKERADEVAARIGAQGIIGQAETLDEFWTSVAHGRNIVIGNLSSIVQDAAAVKKINNGEMVFVNEFYWNQDKSKRPDNHGLPVLSLCVACYDGHSDSTSPYAWHPHMPDYEQAGYTWLTMSAYGPGMTADDYRRLP